MINLWVKKCQFQILFFFPQPVFSSTCAVTEVQALLTSLANRVPHVESGHQELCCLKHLSSYFFHPFLNRPAERAVANLSVSREVLHFNPKLTETIPPQFKFYFFLTRHHPLLCMDQTSTRSITVKTKPKSPARKGSCLRNGILIFYCTLHRCVSVCDFVVALQSDNDTAVAQPGGEIEIYLLDLDCSVKCCSPSITRLMYYLIAG